MIQNLALSPCEEIYLFQCQCFYFYFYFFKTIETEHSFECLVNQFEIITAQKIKFCSKDFFSKCDQIRRKLRKKSLMENCIFYAVDQLLLYFHFNRLHFRGKLNYFVAWASKKASLQQSECGNS